MSETSLVQMNNFPFDMLYTDPSRKKILKEKSTDV